MLLEPNKAELIVMSVIVSHNYLRAHSPNLYTPHGSLDYEENEVLIEGSWRNDENMNSIIPLRNTPRSSAYFQKIIDEIFDYCVKEGVLPWQNSYA
jgi:hypothetical protein